jgi:hypothetical protein
MPIRPSVQARDPRTHLGAFLGQHLKTMRLAGGFQSQEAITAAMAPLDRSVIGKAESGEAPLTERLLARYMELCGVPPQIRPIFMGMNRIARIRDNPGQAQVAPWFETEARAHTLRFWAPMIVPGIAQTPAYAGELFRAMGLSPEKIAEYMEIRLGRQSLLTRDDVDVTLVIWEYVLHHQIGTPEGMHEQVARLLEISYLPTVALHVLPATLGANTGLGGAINLAATHDTPELLLSDSLVTDQPSQETAVVRKASATFNSLRADSLNRADTRIKLTEAMERWRD